MLNLGAKIHNLICTFSLIDVFTDISPTDNISSDKIYLSFRDGSDWVDQDNVLTVFVVPTFKGDIFERLQVSWFFLYSLYTSTAVQFPKYFMFSRYFNTVFNYLGLD